MAKNFNDVYWNQRYIDKQTGWDLEAVSPPLKNYIDQVKNKNLKILIPGCGNSYEAEYLLKEGFTDVTVIDIAETPIEKLEKQFAGNKNIKIKKQDFFAMNETFDLILEQTFFCALHPSLRNDYVKQMHVSLAEGGKLVGVLFKTEFEKEGPPFGGTRSEYEKLFQKYFYFHIFEDCYNSIAPRMANEIFICFVKNGI